MKSTMKKIFSILAILTIALTSATAKEACKFFDSNIYPEIIYMVYWTENNEEEDSAYVVVFDYIDWCYYCINFNDNDNYNGAYHQRFIQDFLRITREIQPGKYIEHSRLQEITKEVHKLVQNTLKGCSILKSRSIDDEDFGDVFVYLYIKDSY